MKKDFVLQRRQGAKERGGEEVWVIGPIFISRQKDFGLNTGFSAIKSWIMANSGCFALIFEKNCKKSKKMLTTIYLRFRMGFVIWGATVERG